MKKIAAALALVSGSFLLCFLALETAFRLLGYGAVGDREGNVVHHVVQEFDHYAVLNSLELRDSELAPKQPDEFRILALGDSFTYGLGVEEEQTFVRQTEQILRKRARQAGLSTNFRIVNCGIGGGPYRQSDWLHEVGLSLEPDLVVQTFFIGNDVYDDHWWEETRENLRRGLRPTEGFRASMRRSIFLDWLWGRMIFLPFFDQLLFDMGLRYENRGLFLKDQPELENRAWATSFEKITKIGQTLESHNVDWLVMIVPTSVQVRFGDRRPETENYRLPNEKLNQLLVEQEVEFIDLLPLIESQPGKNDFYYRRDLHWTAEGHRFAAETLADRLWGLVATN